MKMKDRIPYDNSNCPQCHGRGDAFTCDICYEETDKYNKKMGYWGTWTWCKICKDFTKGCEHKNDLSKTD